LEISAALGCVESVSLTIYPFFSLKLPYAVIWRIQKAVLPDTHG
jgi:hypothetical protein